MEFAINTCYFCSETDNLIHMDTNSLIIDSIYIDFAQLILDLIQIKISDDYNNMICVACKDQLSQFYIMKQRAKSMYLKPDDIRKMEIIDTLTAFLDSTVEDCVVSKHQKLLAVHPATNNHMVTEQLYSCSCLLESEMDQLEDPIEYNVIEVKPEMGEFVTESYEIAQIEVGDESSIVTLEKGNEDFFEVYESKADRFQSPTKKRPKKYQKSTLDPKQREWVRKEIKQSAFVVETSFGNKTQWACNKCNFKTSSENSFRIHLKTHFHDGENIKTSIKRQTNPVDDASFIEQKLWIQQQLQSQKETVESSEGQTSMWTCSQCEFSCNKRGRFRHHLQKSHTTILMRGPNKHSCFSCHLRFDGDNHLQVHLNCHKIFDTIVPHVQSFSCDACRMFFCTVDDLQIHINRHKENPQALRDPVIAVGVVHRNGESFVSVDDDIQEILDEHSPTCGHCLLKFASENECKIHLMLYHLTVFTCPFDSREFPGIPTLSFGNHLRQCHPDVFQELEIKCSFCHMQFENVYEKLAHMKKCRAKVFQCDHCDRAFFRKAELLHHLKVVMGLMVFACELCGKRCKDQGDLKTHVRIHTGDRPYPCPHCEKAYKTSSARASHVESHMDSVHVCGICNVKFRRRILYQRHMKLLHDESYRQKCFAENTCSICGKSYLRKTHYKNHMKSHNIDK